MRNNKNGIEIKLSGNWDNSGVILQIESLSALHELESGQEKFCRIDCSKISSVDMSGLQLLHTWMQCIRLRGTKPELINMSDDMQRKIKRLGLEKCFADFYTDAA